MKLLIPTLELMFSFFIPLIVSIFLVIISVIGFSAGRSFFLSTDGFMVEAAFE